MCVFDLFYFPHVKGLLPYSLIVFMNDADFSYIVGYLLTFYPDRLLVLEGCTQISVCTRWAYLGLPFRKIACPNFCIHMVDSWLITYNTCNSRESDDFNLTFFFRLFKIFISKK